MHDALTVRAVQGAGHGNRNRQGFADANRTAGNPGGERFALEVLHDEEIDAAFVTDVVQRADVRIAQRRNRARLAFEPLLHLGVVRPM